MNKKKLLFVVNVDWFFVSHRLPIALKAMEDGYEVHLLCAVTDKFEYLESRGLIVHPFLFSRSGENVFNEIACFFGLYKQIKNIKPDLLHLVTIKPVLYGGIAARLAGAPAVVAAISGLGFVFFARGKKAAIVRSLVSGLYRLALGKRNLKVICQNSYDREILIKAAGLSRNKVVMIPGSGVDLSAYVVLPSPQGDPVVVMASRLLRDKGVFEFADAAKLLAQRGVAARFWLVGDVDPGNPATITQDELHEWGEEGYVELLGYRDDIPCLFSQANIVVLPSYYGEGLPKVLVEAAACGRAVVTTDHPGCRDAIEPEKSGLLVPIKNSTALADAIQRLVDDPQLCNSMGRAGRNLAERDFAIEKIVNTHLEIYKELEMDA